MSLVLLTGALGLVGSYLADVLAAEGHVVMGIDDLSHNAITVDRSSCEHVEIGSLEYLMQYEVASYDYIIHCASPIGHAKLTPDANVAWRIISDTRYVIDWASRHKSRLITFSTSEVLAYRGETDSRAQYALGKLVGEAMGLASHVPTQIIRPYNVVGLRQRSDGGFVLARFVEQATSGRPLTIFGSGSQRRCFTHVSDLVSFVLALMKRWPSGNHVWSVFNPENSTTIAHLAAMVTGAAGGDNEILYNCDGCVELGNPHWRDTRERKRPEVEYLKCRALGWEPRVGLEEIVKELVESKQRVEAARV